MHLARARLSNITPFEDVTLSFCEGESTRRVNVVFGGDRTGKTTLLATIATTRPGFAIAPPPLRRQGERPSFVACEWQLGEDDPERPHPLLVASPTAQIDDELPEQGVFRRKEQTLFDRRAQEQGGFALLLVSGARWFSRTANLLSQPDRTVGRYDVRAAPALDDATRADLTRETKQILSYAAIGSSLERAKRAALARAGEAAVIHPHPNASEFAGRLDALQVALDEALAIALEPFGRTWVGVQPETLEPVFSNEDGVLSPFEELPRGARHLVAIVTLATRTLAGAYSVAPGADGSGAMGSEVERSPRDREGVVLVDDVEVGQDAPVARVLPQLLSRALPRVQWILTTSSPLVFSACAPGETVALRRNDRRVEIHEGDLALLH